MRARSHDRKQDEIEMPKLYQSLHRHIIIDQVKPSVDGGRHPVKRVVGDVCLVTAHVFRDGPGVIRASVKWRKKGQHDFQETRLEHRENDEWYGEFPLGEIGRFEFRVEAWADELATWFDFLKRKTEAGEDVRSELMEGAHLLERLVEEKQVAEARELMDLARWLQDFGRRESEVVERLLRPDVEALVVRADLRSDIASSQSLEIIVDPHLALFGAWYEMFPRSQTSDASRPGTLRDAAERLSYVKQLGFDVVYLPPIHPIGTTNRKGKNNSLKAAPGDPGSPWQIGSAAGGHDAVEPSLGTVEDFRHFVESARQMGLETALDFAIQCSPDHPWVKQHPEWFSHRPDGTIKYAENPPKKYQDIYPVDFDTKDEFELWNELKRLVLFWVEQGAKIFRVDNPHTKPVRFWAWLIDQVKREHPETIFLAEAFTRPKMMKILAKVGFTQSYTYFTWRDTKQEFTEYLTELAKTETREYFRPNFFANTPDILPPVLQYGGRPAFKMRLILAATLSPSYGIYSGYELCENEAIPGTEEYLNSEKYEIRVRDFDQRGNIKGLIARINEIRRENPALQRLDNIEFLTTDNDQLLAYLKRSQGNSILVVVNLDPFNPHHGTVLVPPELVGASRYRVKDLISGQSYEWSDANYVRLDPQHEPAHVFRVER